VSTILCADLDTDGASEILVLGGDRLVVLDARGDLAVKTRVPTPPASRFAAGDFDRDGDIDVVTVDFIDVFQLDGDGSGGFGEAHRVARLWAAEDVFAADIDADGMTDLLIDDRGVWYQVTSVRVMMSTSGGLHTSRRFMTAAPSSNSVPPPRLAVADINLDGAPDIISTRHGQVLVFYAYP
jgi:hypothetical protein